MKKNHSQLMNRRDRNLKIMQGSNLHYWMKHSNWLVFYIDGKEIVFMPVNNLWAIRTPDQNTITHKGGAKKFINWYTKLFFQVNKRTINPLIVTACLALAGALLTAAFIIYRKRRNKAVLDEKKK